MAWRDLERDILKSEQNSHQDRRDPASKGDGRRDIDSVIERKPRGDVVCTHHQSDEEKCAKGSA